MIGWTHRGRGYSEESRAISRSHGKCHTNPSIAGIVANECIFGIRRTDFDQPVHQYRIASEMSCSVSYPAIRCATIDHDIASLFLIRLKLHSRRLLSPRQPSV